ncbi:acyl-CoA dehydrogenase family protein [Paraburkholderia sp. LEh10]|uniref:acyl-CoA dehydrogenase family protein n=1 Tax=Paraburkholderia sp. LEh10 TaxID=2821353 RepID=UPI001AE8C0F6|nr:acyl-CoA dehydrogenase family protein [Paraburkholderia sp. LEh10]MBP0593292.1 acyl-CoA dehydrogenase family protein [Paraburkholderia sp. LEh10]
MDLQWSDRDLAFRDEVRAFLATHLTDELRAAGRLMTSVYADHHAAMAWQRILAAKGWAAPAWPIEYGGCGWTATQRYLFARERVAAGAPPLSPMGIQMCAPALIKFGTDAQKAYFLPRMLSGEHVWCQGYSEPQSGSDLASLKMHAREDGDDLVCDGSKIWATHAHDANWIFCLVRTSREDKPQLGITFLLIDMRTPGISIQPIVMSSGEHIQNQVFFDQVRVPKVNVIGTIGAGWTVAKYVLEFERGGTAYTPELHEMLDNLREFAKTAPGETTERLIDDPHFASKLAAARIRIAALEVYELRTMSALSAGRSPGTNASVMKILGTELSQHLTELGMEAAGRYGRSFQPQAACPGGPVKLWHTTGPYVGAQAAMLAPLRYLNDRAGSIYAGSNEIQRNILAKAALGLH